MDPRIGTLQPLKARLASHIADGQPLAGGEVEVLRVLHERAHAVRRGHHVVTQGRPSGGLWLLADGFALRYKVLTDGKRQVFHVALPGDLLGYPACFFQRALYSVVALTDASVCQLTFAELYALFEAYPRLAMALFSSGAGEAAMYVERLAAVGQRGALERVAHFVLEMASRLHAAGLGDGTAFHMPLTQEQIADVLGLSAPHVNRMLRRLREEGLIEVVDSSVRLLNRAALADLADFDGDYLAVAAARPHDAPHAAGAFLASAARNGAPLKP
ncbi:MAG: Crp/Fnr family transcriptional regulator [Burkholderiales bacterium]|nr:Crp/Fnr family transcriptional regulator [Burkholderiales bacterium]